MVLKYTKIKNIVECIKIDIYISGRVTVKIEILCKGFTMTCIYAVDTRIGLKKKTTDPRVPFSKFYLVPISASLESLKCLAPYSLVAPLVEGYREVLADAKLKLEDLSEYQVLIPIHMKQVQIAELGPTYISNKRWQRNPKNLEKFLPDSSPLITPDKIFDPVCLSCENHLEHMCGECSLGTVDCLQHIKLPVKLKIEGKDVSNSC